MPRRGKQSPYSQEEIASGTKRSRNDTSRRANNTEAGDRPKILSLQFRAGEGSAFACPIHPPCAGRCWRHRCDFRAASPPIAGRGRLSSYVFKKKNAAFRDEARRTPRGATLIRRHGLTLRAGVLPVPITEAHPARVTHPDKGIHPAARRPIPHPVQAGISASRRLSVLSSRWVLFLFTAFERMAQVL